MRYTKNSHTSVLFVSETMGGALGRVKSGARPTLISGKILGTSCFQQLHLLFVQKKICF